MEVNRDNFEKLLPLVEESIQSADFVAFDAEFSGKTQISFGRLKFIWKVRWLFWRYKVNDFLTIRFDPATER